MSDELLSNLDALANRQLLPVGVYMTGVAAEAAARIRALETETIELRSRCADLDESAALWHDRATGLQSDLAAARADAERYRWIRDRAQGWEWRGMPHPNTRIVIYTSEDTRVTLYGSNIDTLMDDVMRKFTPTPGSVESSVEGLA